MCGHRENRAELGLIKHPIKIHGIRIRRVTPAVQDGVEGRNSDVREARENAMYFYWMLD